MDRRLVQLQSLGAGLVALLIPGCGAVAPDSDIATIRARALGLVTLRASQTPLQDVVPLLQEQTGMDVRIGRGVDPLKPVTLEAVSMPFHRFIVALCQAAGCSWVRGTDMETDAEHWELRGKWDGPPAWSITEGGALSFTAKPFRNGCVLTVWRYTTPGVSLWGRIERVVDEVGNPLSIERCGKCGDSTVFVESGAHKKIKVVFEGHRVWTSESVYAVPDPAAPGDFSQGKYRIRYEYPKVTVTSTDPEPLMKFPLAHLRGTLSSDGHVLPWIPRRPMSFLTYAPVVKSWCRCADGPVVEQKPNPLMREQTFDATDYTRRRPVDFKSMEVVVSWKTAEPVRMEGSATLR